ncbi:hypothetical protein BaOVIS_030760 [Babesia ovis]|uniref:Uncharacterized protein n=1 Tax=Babesia ovis TaxID=5869 RepID=A0A9W5TCF5_BABOV|nr:hypothetical protein BaOVIS_030760 [Babesia ovis]
MTCCCYCRKKVPKGESPVIELNLGNNVQLDTGNDEQKEQKAEVAEVKHTTVTENVPPTSTLDFKKDVPEEIDTEKQHKNKTITSTFDEIPIVKSTNTSSKSWWEADDTGDNKITSYGSTTPVHTRDDIKLSNSLTTESYKSSDSTNKNHTSSQEALFTTNTKNNGSFVARQSSKDADTAYTDLKLHFSNDNKSYDNQLDNTSKVSTDLLTTSEVDHKETAKLIPQATTTYNAQAFKQGTADPNNTEFENKVPSNDGLNMNDKHDFERTNLDTNTETYTNETPEDSRTDNHVEINERNTVGSTFGGHDGEGFNKSENTHNIESPATTSTSTTVEDEGVRSKPIKPKSRPAPLKRGTTRIPVRRKAEPPKPTAAGTIKLLEKMNSLSESKCAEIIKCHTELCNIADKHPEILSECDPAALILAVRTIATHANSGRSNISNTGIICLGHLYKAVGANLSQPLPDVLDVCVRKAASGSPEFICTSANLTLAKICLSSSGIKLTSTLSKIFKTNKSAHLTLLNCMIIVLDSMGSNMIKLKVFSDILDMASSSLKAGSSTVRNAAKILVGLINDHEDVLKLLEKMRKGTDAIRSVDTAIKKYNYEDKIKYLQQLTYGAI